MDIIRPPDFVAAYVEEAGRITLSRSADRWQAEDVEVTAEAKQLGARKTLALSVASPRSPLERLQLRWSGRLPEDSRFLGDHWERSYGDLEWRGFDADRVMPWYFLAATGQGTHGYGVKTGAGAFCFWQVDAEGISLWLDVRNGGSGVQLGERRLAAAEVVALRGQRDVSPYRSACSLCRSLLSIRACRKSRFMVPTIGITFMVKICRRRMCSAMWSSWPSCRRSTSILRTWSSIWDGGRRGRGGPLDRGQFTIFGTAELAGPDEKAWRAAGNLGAAAFHR